jgi:hypothetical protein
VWCLRCAAANYLLNVAWTDVSLMIDTLHVGAVPEQAPLQPTNDFPSGGVAVSVTVVPWVNLAEHAPPAPDPG